MNQQTIENTMLAAIATLQQEEATILQFDVGERTICACLAAILKRTFDHHAVHVEYNRHGIYPKEIENGGAIFDHGSGGIVLLRAA